MPNAQSILVVEDDFSTPDGLTELLETHGYRCDKQKMARKRSRP